MAKRKDRIAEIRRGILIGVAVLIAAVAVFGIYYSLGLGSDEPYVALDRPEGSGDVEVAVFFSYTCPICQRFEDALEDWADDLPDGVTVERIHIASSPTNRMFAKAQVALDRHGAADANQRRIFRAIHDRNRRFDTVDAIADFVDGFGIDRATFLRTFSSPRIAQAVSADEQEFISLGLLGVPAVVVDDKYVINMSGGRKQALAATDDLVRALIAQRAGSTASDLDT